MTYDQWKTDSGYPEPVEEPRPVYDDEPCDCANIGQCDGSCTHPKPTCPDAAPCCLRTTERANMGHDDYKTLLEKEPFPQPNRNRRGKEPCGECHIQPGETCDICGAVRF